MTRALCSFGSDMVKTLVNPCHMVGGIKTLRGKCWGHVSNLPLTAGSWSHLGLKGFFFFFHFILFYFVMCSQHLSLLSLAGHRDKLKIKSTRKIIYKSTSLKGFCMFYVKQFAHLQRWPHIFRLKKASMILFPMNMSCKNPWSLMLGFRQLTTSGIQCLMKGI